MADAIEIDRSPHDRGVASKTPPEQRLAQDRDGLAAALIFLSYKRAADHHGRTEHFEDAVARENCRNRFGAFRAGERPVQGPENAGGGEHRLLPVNFEGAQIDRKTFLVQSQKLIPDHHQAIGAGIGQRPQQERIGHAENRGHRPDAQRQRQNRRDKKSRRPPKTTQSVAKISQHGSHLIVGTRRAPATKNDGLPYNKHMQVTLPDGSVQPVEPGAKPLDVAQSISKRLADDAIVARVNGELWDLNRPLESDATLEILTTRNPESLEVYRHSTAHLLAAAVLELFPGTKLGIGPPIETGFYYDFQRAEPFTADDLEKIEKRM